MVVFRSFQQNVKQLVKKGAHRLDYFTKLYFYPRSFFFHQSLYSPTPRFPELSTPMTLRRKNAIFSPTIQTYKNREEWKFSPSSQIQKPFGRKMCKKGANMPELLKWRAKTSACEYQYRYTLLNEGEMPEKNFFYAESNGYSLCRQFLKFSCVSPRGL